MRKTAGRLLVPGIAAMLTVLLAMPISGSSFPLRILSRDRFGSPAGNYRHASCNGFGDCLEVVRGMRAHCAIGPYKSIPRDHRGRRMHLATRSVGIRPHRRVTVLVCSRTRYRERPELVVIVPVACAVNVDGLDERTHPNSRNVARAANGKREQTRNRGGARRRDYRPFPSLANAV